MNETQVIINLISADKDTMPDSLAGLACSAGLFVGARRIDDRICSDRESGVKLLVNRLLESAVIENPALTIASEGLAYDRCAVAVVTGIDESGPLAEYGLRPGDIILGVDKSDAKTPSQLGDMLREGRSRERFTLRYLRAGEKLSAVVINPSREENP
jgi:cyanophycin synthetase